jgi:hypothetical protein
MIPNFPFPISADGQPMFPPPFNPTDLGRGPMIMGITWTLTTLCILTVGLRMSSRRKAAGGVAIDDWLMFATLILDLVSQAFITVAYSYGLGKEDMNLKLPDEALNVAKWSWFVTIPGMLVTPLGRISVAILLIRLFGTRPAIRWFFIAQTALLGVMHIVMLVCVWVQHNPVEALWNPFLAAFQPVKSWDPRIVLYIMYFTQSLCTFTDITFVFIPVAIIWKLHMPLHRRLGLIFVLGVSLFTAVMSILKTVTATNGGPLKPNAGYNASLSLLYVFIEQSLVIILGCVPALYSGARAEFSAIWKFTSSSVSRLIPSRATATGKSTGSSYYKSTGTSGTYQDLEMNSKKFSSVNESVRRAPSARSGSHEDLVHGTYVEQVNAPKVR